MTWKHKLAKRLAMLYSYFAVAAALTGCGGDRSPVAPEAPGTDPTTSASITFIAVSPETDSGQVGEVRTFNALPADSTGRAVAGVRAGWRSTDTSVARVDAEGTVTLVGPGEADIVASAGGRSGKGRVKVKTAPVATVEVSPATAGVAVGGTVQLAAVTKDASGAVLPGRTVTWTTGSAGVATVSAGGLVTGVAGGTATITATSEGQAASATVTVTASAPPPPPPPPPAGSCTPTGSGVCRYVDGASGNDANAGTSSAPYRTIQKAASVVNAGDVVIVRDGVYTGGTTVVSIGRSGSASAWITFRAEHRWGAVVDGRSATSAGGINVSGRYIRIEGFEVRGTNRYGIEVYGGSDVVVAQNHIHDIGRICTSSSGGIVGVNAYVPNLVIERNVIHDIGRWAHGENGCSTTNSYWQNHDHGIYQGEGNNLVVRNNVFYNLQRGWAFQRYSGSGTTVTSLAIVHNTFVGANPYKDGQIIIATGATGLVITNNVFYQPRTAAVYFDAPGLVAGTMANNLVYGASLTTGSTLGMLIAGTLTGDPRFVSVTGRDFRLQAGSPAIDAGLTLSVVLNDLLGDLRPQGLGYDIGAYEYR